MPGSAAPASVTRGLPYVVPVCFGYEAGTLRIRSGPEEEKVGLITANPGVSFEFDEVSGTVPAESPCAWGMRYESVIGRDLRKIVRDFGEKTRGLSCITRQYSDRETFRSGSSSEERLYDPDKKMQR